MTTRYLDPSDWHRQGAPAGAILTKTGAVRALPGVGRLVEAVISTGRVDREGDTISPAGWDFTGFMASGGPVLWGHAHAEPPIARAVARPRVEGERVVAQAEFPPVGTSEKADLIHRLITAGIITATSVGFKPLRWAFNERRGGVDFLEQELLEFSFVSVPANADAVVVAAKAAGLSLARLGLERAGRDDAVLVLLDHDADAEIVLRVDTDEWVTLDLARLATPEPSYRIDPWTVPALVRAGVAEVVGAAVGREVRRLRGRVD